MDMDFNNSARLSNNYSASSNKPGTGSCAFCWEKNKYDGSSPYNRNLQRKMKVYFTVYLSASIYGPISLIQPD